MSLYLVATPIGNSQDISLRGLEVLKSSEVIILEERKESTAFLRSHGISGKQYEQLNEHSTPEDLEFLLELCRTKSVALITDCGTPGFADPGADLVRLCRKNKVEIRTAPGASSLMTILSLSSQRLDSFLYRGFLAVDTTLRRQQWSELRREKQAIILMDTPYRLQRTLSELVDFFPGRKVLMGVNLTQTEESVHEGLSTEVKEQIQVSKAEFILLIYPPSSSTGE
jgi:16S rRNA (cytidine1402-2'-O)-methyltransferase